MPPLLQVYQTTAPSRLKPRTLSWLKSRVAVCLVVGLQQSLKVLGFNGCINCCKKILDKILFAAAVEKWKLWQRKIFLNQSKLEKAEGLVSTNGGLALHTTICVEIIYYCQLLLCWSTIPTTAARFGMKFHWLLGCKVRLGVWKNGANCPRFPLKYKFVSLHS